MAQMNIALSTVGRIAKYHLYGCLTLVLVLGEANVVSKIALAAYVGVYTIVLLCYSWIVYLKSFQIVPEKHQGLLKLALNLLPLILEKVSRLLIEIVTFGLRVIGVSTKNTAVNELVVAFGIVSLRKLVALLCWAYITQEDDNSLHLKAFLAFCLMNLIQTRFIIKNDTVKTDRVSWSEGFRSFVNRSAKFDKRQSQTLRFRRNALFLTNSAVSVLLFVSMFKYYWQLQNSYFKVMSVMIRLVLVLDLEFLRTLCDEFHGFKVVVGGEKSNV
ncbi:hypothetical protein OGAPHI_000203 [Ogataea philodendri]|uniref:Uncharacterized protein n=1 Tax=Ogataea philodendri TaxID=1378263 RepID=A0A9P8PH91_9ASCO|nr:uncharacterized protein OGAPHI_000203 [Ogataea philodendri]KAH3671500.1 hypothetical protein OGAPHI_000203 [Ogataea philodendri]